jgi:tetratricopeptide (TPR) repeat protein
MIEISQRQKVAFSLPSRIDGSTTSVKDLSKALLLNVGFLLVSLQFGAFACIARAQDVRERAMEAWMAYQQQDYTNCARLYAEVIALDGGNKDSYYNAACCFALSGDPSQAFSYLRKAVAAGYKDVDHLQQDPDLHALRNDPRWAEVVEKAQIQLQAYLQTINVELYELFKQDQADRMQEQIDWEALRERDRQRHARVLQMLEEGVVKAADDLYHAAMILHHFDDSTSHRMARDLAQQAIVLDPASMRAKWLAAAAQDRYLWKIGEPQWYGTQFQPDSTGRWTLEPIDTTAVTDEERLQHGVPPLAEIRQQLELMNQQDLPPPVSSPHHDEDDNAEQDEDND